MTRVAAGYIAEFGQVLEVVVEMSFANASVIRYGGTDVRAGSKGDQDAVVIFHLAKLFAQEKFGFSVQRSKLDKFRFVKFKLDNEEENGGPSENPWRFAPMQRMMLLK